MPAIICNAPQGQEYLAEAPILFDFTVEPPVVQPTSWWQPDCANDEHSQPKYAVEINVPTNKTDVSTYAEFVAAVGNTSIQRINVTASIGTSSAQLTIDAGDSSNSTRYITASSENITIPALWFNGARNWVVTGASISSSYTSKVFLLSNVTDVIIDGIQWRPSSGRSTFFHANSAGFGAKCLRPTVQRCTIIYNAATQHRESVCIGSGGHLSDNPFHVWNGQIGAANQYTGHIEDYHIYDNYIEEAGDGIQITSVTFTERARPADYHPAPQRPYWSVTYPGLHIAGNTITTVNENENAIDLKAGSEDPNNPGVIEDNFFHGYYRSATGTDQIETSPTGITAHIRKQHLIIRRNIIYNCKLAMSCKAYESHVEIYDNLAINCDSFYSGDEYYLASDDHSSTDISPTGEFHRNVWVRSIGGGNAYQAFDMGYGTTVQFEGTATCNFFEGGSINANSGTNVWTDQYVSSAISGSNNFSRASSSVSGITGNSTYQDRMTNITLNLAQCGGAPNNVTVKGLIVTSDVPSSCAADFVWTT